AFNMYLQDIRGPTHYLDCFLQAHDLHNHIHKHFSRSTPNRIKLKDKDVPENFRKAVTQKDKDLIKKTMEEIYKELYQRLNHDFVVAFCQSETYLEYLCGPPPDAIELIREEEDDFQEKQKHPIESSLTLSQFRNRLFSIFSNQNNAEEEEKPIPIEEIAEDEVETVPEALLDDGRDLNKWLVTIPRVEPQKDVSGRVYYMYVINIERLDLIGPGEMEDEEDSTSIEAMTWIVTRKYDEFHILEQKLREFHGNNLKIGILPEKKIFNQNRTFMDSQRLQFERFIQGLALQPLLKKSELLYTFLTSEEDICEDISLIPDLNPFRAMKSVPNKLQRERGQNLRPYLLNLLANILAPNTFYSESPVVAKEVNSDQNSLQSFSSDRDLKTKFSSKIALDNLILTKQQTQKIVAEFVPVPSWTKDFTELLLFFAIRIGGFVSEFGIAILLMCQEFSHQIVNQFAKKKTQETLDLILQEDNVLAIIQSLQKTIIDGIQESTEEEQKLRAELAIRRLDQIIEDFLPNSVNQLFGQKNIRQIANDLIKAAQFPRLNKQLAFVLLDAIIHKIRGNNVFDFQNIPKN
uniref:PX domain-containing protein n=2 Tax=Panagrolaimus sp. JU765 TaxID=591449 RepID=A0AC34RBE0_9BILA